MTSRYWPPFQSEPHSYHVWIRGEVMREKIVQHVLGHYDFKKMKYLGFYVEGSQPAHQDLQAVIKELKDQLTAFIVLFEDVAPADKVMEEYYAAGVDGVCLLWEDSPTFQKRLQHAAALWPKGHVFVFLPPHQKLDSKAIHVLMDQAILPVQDPVQEDVILEVLKNLKVTNISLQFVKQIGGFGLPLEESKLDLLLQSAMGRKIHIDLSDLRRKLMVKKVADSFDSAGL
jgi:hypothetical protein